MITGFLAVTRNYVFHIKTGENGFSARKIVTENGNVLSGDFSGSQVILGRDLIFCGERTVSFQDLIALFPVGTESAVQAGRCFAGFHGHESQWKNQTMEVIEEIGEENKVFRISRENRPLCAAV